MVWPVGGTSRRCGQESQRHPPAQQALWLLQLLAVLSTILGVHLPPPWSPAAGGGQDTPLLPAPDISNALPGLPGSWPPVGGTPPYLDSQLPSWKTFPLGTLSVPLIQTGQMRHNSAKLRTMPSLEGMCPRSRTSPTHARPGMHGLPTPHFWLRSASLFQPSPLNSPGMACLGNTVGQRLHAVFTINHRMRATS